MTGLLTAVLGLVTAGAWVWLLLRSFSARQKAAAILYEQREWFRLTLAVIGDAVISTDTEGKVTFSQRRGAGLDRVDRGRGERYSARNRIQDRQSGNPQDG